ncbi:MAG: tetratricopeptide repeat protein [Labilibaculum sp.]|nr:tetratricopeptide repeat protein [Labilibaculum sp.]
MKQFTLLLLLSITINISASFSQNTEKVDQLLFSGQYTEAIPLLHAMLKKDSANSKYYFRLGNAYQKLNKNNRAINNYTKAKQLNPNSTATLLNLSSCFYSSGNYPKAEQELVKLQQLTPNNYSVDLLLAKTYSVQNKYQQSLYIYTKLNQQDSLNPNIHKQMGSLKRRMQNFIGSLDSYIKAYELNPNDLSVIIHIVQQLYEMAAYQQALGYISNGLNTFPNNSMLLKKKAQVLIGLEWYDNALTILKELKTNNKLSTPENRQLGICYMQTRQYEAALKAFTDCGPSLEKDPIINFHTGICYARLDQHEKGIKFLEDALFYITPPIEASMHLFLAKSYEATQQFKKAVVSYKKHFEMDNTNPDILYEIATIYEEFGENKDNSLAYYTKFIQQTNEKDDLKYEYAKSRILHIKENIHFEK